jgi:2-dehydropantoate 2-reductase
MAHAGAPVVMIGRQAFVDSVSRDGLYLDTLRFRKYVAVEASTDLSSARNADLVLFCVKTVDNAAAARELAPYLSPQTTVVSFQNGVDNVDQIHAAANISVLSAAVYVAASVTAPGRVKHAGRGDLVLGPNSMKVRQVAKVFTDAEIPCRISDNIEGELWTKLLWNCALNAISALGQATYGRIALHEEAHNLVQAVVDEVLAVARAAHVVLPAIANSQEAMAGAMKIAQQMVGALSSTAQDINRGKRTEIDSLNGYISRRGAELGVPTPVNNTLCTLVKVLESR